MNFNFEVILIVIGVLAFFVSVVTEVTKNITYLQKIPTDLQVLTISILFTVLSYFAYVSYSNAKIVWYYIGGSIIIGFLVAFVAMYGWEKLSSLWTRFKKGNDMNEKH